MSRKRDSFISADEAIRRYVPETIEDRKTPEELGQEIAARILRDLKEKLEKHNLEPARFKGNK